MLCPRDGQVTNNSASTSDRRVCGHSHSVGNSADVSREEYSHELPLPASLQESQVALSVCDQLLPNSQGTLFLMRKGEVRLMCPAAQN